MINNYGHIARAYEHKKSASYVYYLCQGIGKRPRNR